MILLKSSQWYSAGKMFVAVNKKMDDITPPQTSSQNILMDSLVAGFSIGHKSCSPMLVDGTRVKLKNRSTTHKFSQRQFLLIEVVHNNIHKYIILCLLKCAFYWCKFGFDYLFNAIKRGYRIMIDS